MKAFSQHGRGLGEEKWTFLMKGMNFAGEVRKLLCQPTLKSTLHTPIQQRRKTLAQKEAGSY